MYRVFDWDDNFCYLETDDLKRAKSFCRNLGFYPGSTFIGPMPVAWVGKLETVSGDWAGEYVCIYNPRFGKNDNVLDFAGMDKIKQMKG